MTNDVTLRELFERELAALAAKVKCGDSHLKEESNLRWASHGDLHTGLDHAREQFASALSDRLDAMNEFRAQLAQQASTFITRESVQEHEAAHQLVHDHTRERIAELEQWRAAVDAKFWALGIGFTIFTFVVNVLVRYLFPNAP